MPKVTMMLTDTDAKNVEFIEQNTNARSKAHAVGIAISIAQVIIEASRHGSKLIMQHKNGESDRVIMPELRHDIVNTGEK